MAWTPQTPISVDMPGTAEWANSVQDNLVAVADGAVGAPRVAPKALSTNFLASFSTTTTGVAVTGLGGFRRIRISGFCQAPTVTPWNLMGVSFSNNGTTWGATQQIGSFGATSNFGFVILEIDLVSGAAFGVAVDGQAGRINLDKTYTLPSGVVTAVRFHAPGSNQIGTIYVTAEEGRSDV